MPVAKGDSVFRYYSSGEEELKNKITELDVEIQSLMQNEKSSFRSLDDRTLLYFNDSMIKNTLRKIFLLRVFIIISRFRFLPERLPQFFRHSIRQVRSLVPQP